MRPFRRISAALLTVLLLGIVSSLFGATAIPFSDVAGAMLGSSTVDETNATIFWELRLPRTMTAVFVGASLAAAGCAFQGLFRNPLAEPYIIGASSGAGLGVAVVVISGLQLAFFSIGATALLAVAGAFSVVLLVMAIASSSGAQSSATLLLSGVVISSMVNAIVSLLMFLCDQQAVVILTWLMGSLAGSHWGTAALVGTLGGVGMSIVLLSARALDAYSLGDTVSESLGLNLMQFRWIVVAAASLCTAAAVAVSGIVGFVGLIGPHIARSIVGPKHVDLIPMSTCVGAILMLVADTIARTIIAPAELPVGIVTALLGCPFFLWLLFFGPQSRSVGRLA
ncbi:MAG TPA: iron ABC transporter permease [Planctomycetaceae bacterium]|nr:iron ABC transporter permease [Planctomycetaceae bacterium]